MAYGSVLCTLEIFSNFSTYKGSGVFKSDFLTQGHHAMRIIGWGTSNGDDYWLITNSYGEEFGDKGLMKIVMGDISNIDQMLLAHVTL